MKTCGKYRLYCSFLFLFSELLLIISQSVFFLQPLLINHDCTVLFPFVSKLELITIELHIFFNFFLHSNYVQPQIYTYT